MDKNLLKQLSIQTIGLVLTALILDGGFTFRYFVAGCIIYWIFALLKSRSDKQDAIDRFLLKYGAFVFAFCVYITVRYIFRAFQLTI